MLKIEKCFLRLWELADILRPIFPVKTVFKVDIDEGLGFIASWPSFDQPGDIKERYRPVLVRFSASGLDFYSALPICQRVGAQDLLRDLVRRRLWAYDDGRDVPRDGVMHPFIVDTTGRFPGPMETRLSQRDSDNILVGAARTIAIEPKNCRTFAPEDPLYNEALSLSMSVSAVRKAQGKLNPKDFEPNSPELFAVELDYMRDLQRAMGVNLAASEDDETDGSGVGASG